MHSSSMDKMRAFRDKYLAPKQNEALRIIDIGAQEVHENGSYKPLFKDFTNWKYQGVDMVAGNNVDIVLQDPYDWKQIDSNSVDVVISGQAFEHIEFFWITMLEVARVLRPGGICCIIAPSGGYEHRYPVDCWRFYPDGFTALAKYARLDPVEVYTQWEDLSAYDPGTNCWHDSVLIAKKNHTSGWRDCLRRYLIQLSRSL
ncbi:MAG: methyltransferase domain-containing protein [Burkholderiales bacterium]|nr:methyltransferase domain-containing protein [Burkholderiales bacterium]